MNDPEDLARGMSARLAHLADAAADARDLDWDAEASSADNDQERHAILGLGEIATIVRLSRAPIAPPAVERADPAGESTTRPAPDAVAHPPDLTSWGPFAVREMVGRGTFGTVYRAWDDTLEREYALKILHDVDPGAAGRLVREARLLARLRHPNVVTVFGVDQFSGRVGFWMEMIQGRTLEDIQKTQGLRSAEEASLIGLDLCRALAAVHQADLLHCDIKAQNVMRAVGGRTVLMDFGAAAVRRADPSTGRRVGTPVYMAPELFDGAPPTVSSDVYSLGVLLYYLVSGTYPVPADSVERLQQAHRDRRRQWLRDARPDLPPAFVRAVDAATAIRPEDRPASAGALEVLLQHAVDGSGRPRPVPLERSVAVLRFDDLSPDRRLDYLCEGIAEEIINALVRVPGVHVIGRGSSFTFDPHRYDRHEVASALRVETILEGSVRTVGSRLRVMAQLIDAGDGVCLWGERFDREIENVFEVQDGIARAVGDVLGARVARRSESGDAGIASTRSIEAYTLCLRGRFAWNRRTESSLVESIDYFERAIDRDPQYAAAYAGLAEACATLGFYGGLAPDTAMPRAKAAARRAIDLSAAMPGPHATLACVAAAYERRWDVAEASFERAIALAPAHPTARQWYAITYLVPQQRFEDAAEALRRAAESDPLSTPIRASAGLLQYFAHRFDDAERLLRETLALDASSGTARLFLGLTLVELGRSVDALQELTVARATAPSPEMIAAVGYAAARAGHDAAARQALADLDALARTRYVSPSLMAQVHAGLGDTAAALDRLEEANRVRALDLVWLAVRPVFDGLRGDARLRSLIAEIGL